MIPEEKIKPEIRNLDLIDGPSLKCTPGISHAENTDSTNQQNFNHLPLNLMRDNGLWVPTLVQKMYLRKDT